MIYKTTYNLKCKCSDDLSTIDNDVEITVEKLTDNHLILAVKGADMYKQFSVLGDVIFYNTHGGIKTIYRDINSKIESVIKSIPETMQSELETRIAENVTKSYIVEACNLIEGREFLDDVMNNCLTDYDGYINNVFVDGYKSNLGLIANNLKSGYFLVDSVVWLEICDKHTVYVDWISK